MQGVGTVDLFATKGAEYLMVIGYLVLLAAFWRFLWTPSAAKAGAAGVRSPMPLGRWFDVPEGRYFHQGHAWVLPESEDVVRVGMDDFAQKLLGRAAGFVLPEVGARLAPGERGWQVQVDGHAIPMLSPVGGEVVAVNADLLASPGLANADPYDRGWLVKVRVPNPAVASRNLLSGKLARAWMDGMVVLPDGGFPVSGFARAMSPEAWDQVAREFLLSG
ncbi:MAG: glycine cleavage system protein H [Gemmatimonadetes bacterium]|nr:glycine cleavage system protein H [Gemmatimonadota bacterium]